MDTSILEDLGLTNAEIKVYIALLELGNSTAGSILKKSGLQNSVVHRALNTLKEKGLINYVLEGRRHRYQATDPENFYQYIEEKKERFSQVLPALKRKQELATKKENATIFKGMRGVKEVYRIMRETKGEYLSFGGGEECRDRLGTAWWENHHRKRVALKLPSRQVFDETVRDQCDFVNGLKDSEVRLLPQEFASFQETVIVGNKVAITVFTEEPYSFLIEDKKVAEGYRKHFEILWAEARF